MKASFGRPSSQWADGCKEEVAKLRTLLTITNHQIVFLEDDRLLGCKAV
jgi:hypothetical protein